MEHVQRRLKMRYRTVGPKLIDVYVNECKIDDTGSLQQKQVKKQVKTWMVYFPQGHSIRLTQDELVRQGYHLKPRMVDMNTGEIVDHGGDPYDFGIESVEDEFDPSVELADDEDTNPVVDAKALAKKG